MAKDKFMLDVELEDLPPELRWREWMGRIEAVIFASASPVSREDLARVVGQGVSVDMLIEDVVTELKGRPYELMAVADGWMMRTRVQFAQAIRVAADVNEQLMDLNEFEVAVLAAVAYHQPLTRDGLKDIFGKGISRDLIGRLRSNHLRQCPPMTFLACENLRRLVEIGSSRGLFSMTMIKLFPSPTICLPRRSPACGRLNESKR